MYHILVCDDDRDIVAALKIYLTAPDHTIYCAYNGQQALEIARQQPIELILMDIMMPGLDGITATARQQQYTGYPFNRQNGNQRQNPGAERGRGRLYHQAV